MIDSREGYHESRRCSRDTYPQSYVTMYTSKRRQIWTRTHFWIWIQVDRLRVGWLNGCRKSRRCSRDTYPESYITKYTSIQRQARRVEECGPQSPPRPRVLNKKCLFDTMCLFISSRKSTHHKKTQLNISIGNSKQCVDDFVGGVTF